MPPPFWSISSSRSSDSLRFTSPPSPMETSYRRNSSSCCSDTAQMPSSRTIMSRPSSSTSAEKVRKQPFREGKVCGDPAGTRAQSRRGGYLRPNPHVLRNQREQARNSPQVRHQRYPMPHSERLNHVDKLVGQTPLYYAARRGHL